MSTVLVYNYVNLSIDDRLGFCFIFLPFISRFSRFSLLFFLQKKRERSILHTASTHLFGTTRRTQIARHRNRRRRTPAIHRAKRNEKKTKRATVIEKKRIRLLCCLLVVKSQAPDTASRKPRFLLPRQKKISSHQESTSSHRALCPDIESSQRKKPSSSSPNSRPLLPQDQKWGRFLAGFLLSSLVTSAVSEKKHRTVSREQLAESSPTPQP